MVPKESIQNLTYDWVRNCAKLIKSDLLSTVKTAKDLVTIETQLWNQIRYPFGYSFSLFIRISE
jgi:hypothetical protein